MSIIAEDVVIPVTVPAVAAIGSMRLFETVINKVVEFDDPIFIPVTAAPFVMSLIVLPETSVGPPLKLMLIPVIALVPPVILSNVLFVTVFAGPLVLDAPSVLLQPAIVVAPVTVTLEKLFRLFNIVEPVTDDALAPKKVTVPEAPVLLNAVTIELLLTLSELPEGIFPVRVIKVTLPVVLTLMFVKVFELILVAKASAPPPFDIKVIAPVPATVCPNVLKSLLLILRVDVRVPVVPPTRIPFIAPAITPERKEILLLFIEFVNVPTGALENAIRLIPFKVPEVTPPTELATVLKETLIFFVLRTRIPLTVPETFA